MQGKYYHHILFTIFYRNDACRMSGQTRRFKDSRFTGDEDEEEIDGCVAGTAGKPFYFLHNFMIFLSFLKKIFQEYY